VWAVLREPFETEIREGNGVRLRLEGLPPALAGLPWEQLTFADHPPAYDPRTTIVRWYSDEMRRAVRQTYISSTARPGDDNGAPGRYF